MRKLSSILVATLLCMCIHHTWAQNQAKYTVGVQPSISKLTIDGIIEEEDWQKAQVINNFTQNFPTDSLKAIDQTEVRLTYDDTYFYAAFKCYYSLDKNYVVSSLRRDYSIWDNNNIGVNIDPFMDGINGFTFNVSPYGVEHEGLISEGDRVSSNWDNKWKSAVKRHEGYWTAEIAIPFKSIRYKNGTNQWRVNFVHTNSSRNEVSTWVPVGVNYNTSSLAFGGNINFDTPLPKTGANISLIPYVTAQTNRQEGEKNTSKANAGFDAKIAVTPSLNLDLTVNPDFAQVEADVQVLNFQRFEIFFPERRQFFLENSDLFSNLGFSQIRPFFSRRIGIGYDTLTEQNIQTPIFYGARLSGKINKDWRMGILNMQTEARESVGISGQNYTMAAFQRQIFGRSNISGFFVNRQATSNDDPALAYTRIMGIDYNLQSKDNKWSGKAFFHKALRPDNLRQNFAHAAYINYNVRRGYAGINYEYVGKNYDVNDIGFVPRNNHWRAEGWAGYNFYPKNSNSPLFRHGPEFYGNLYTKADTSLLTDLYGELMYRFEFKDSRFFRIALVKDYQYLFSSFDPTNTDGKELEAGTDYDMYALRLAFFSNARKVFTYNIRTFIGNYYNGNRYAAATELNYRFQPYGSVGLSMHYNVIDLPTGFNDATFWLFSPTVDISFTRSVFFKTFIQYNSQADNINVNARLQWRFKPVSDLFIVYTDNYYPDNFKVKNRALVIKLSYWLNV